MTVKLISLLDVVATGLLGYGSRHELSSITSKGAYIKRCASQTPPLVDKGGF